MARGRDMPGYRQRRDFVAWRSTCSRSTRRRSNSRARTGWFIGRFSGSRIVVMYPSLLRSKLMPCPELCTTPADDTVTLLPLRSCIQRSPAFFSTAYGWQRDEHDVQRGRVAGHEQGRLEQGDGLHVRRPGKAGDDDVSRHDDVVEHV